CFAAKVIERWFRVPVLTIIGDFCSVQSFYGQYKVKTNNRTFDTLKINARGETAVLLLAILVSFDNMGEHFRAIAPTITTLNTNDMRYWAHRSRSRTP
ncbi:MAG: hypothetical protein MJK04_01965, partial [Psychrosphaera sp.]|nr:hypothetical protein [Psychrosphaera sp.]